MFEWNTRTELLLGAEQTERLQQGHVLVVGLGGVGAYVAEQLCRAGIGQMTLVDADAVSQSNLNRQLPALHSTLGRPKVEVMKERLLDINPKLKLAVIHEFLRDERIEHLLSAAEYSFVADAIDSLSPKVHLIRLAVSGEIPIVSSMGAGAKTDPSQIKIADISESYNCTLARMVRRKLHGMDIYKGIPVVFSTEKPNPKAVIPAQNEPCKLTTVGTVAYMPALFGCLLASYIIRNI